MGLLVAVLLAARLPFLGHPIPVDVDELAFIGGLGFPAEYPVHHPGYPLWVALGTLTHRLGLPAYAAFQVWSVAASLAAPLLLYRGLRWLVEESPAWWTALAYGVCPLVWFLGTTALSYMTGGACGLAIVGLCCQAIRRARTDLLWAAALLLIVGISLRADLAIYLGPLVLWTGWKLGRRRFAAVALLLIAGGVLNLLLARHLYTRGAGGTISPSLAHTLDVVSGTSVFRLGLVDGLARNLVKIVLNFGWNLGLAAAAVPVCLLALWRRRRVLPRGVGGILLLWIGPGLGFLSLMHVVQGYFVLPLAAAYAIIGLGLQAIRSPARRAAAAVAIVAASTAQFLFWPWTTEGSDLTRLLNAKIAYLSRAGLMQVDRRGEIHSPGDTWRTAAHDRQNPPPAASSPGGDSP